MPHIATVDRVSREELLEFLRDRHRHILMTTRGDGRPQLSPVTGGVDDSGRLVISTYPDRAKAVNLRRNPAASVLILSDEWDDPWVQVDGTAEVLDMPAQDAEDGLVEYFRCIAGEHPATACPTDPARQALAAASQAERLAGRSSLPLGTAASSAWQELGQRPALR